MPQTIYLQPDAPAKPALGAPCNGCGVCCLAEPCPLGMLLSGRRHGPCQALQWTQAAGRYRCGALVDAPAVLQRQLPRALRWAVPLMAWPVQRGAARWIAAGTGCDSDLEPQTGARSAPESHPKEPHP